MRSAADSRRRRGGSWRSPDPEAAPVAGGPLRILKRAWNDAMRIAARIVRWWSRQSSGNCPQARRKRRSGTRVACATAPLSARGTMTINRRDLLAAASLGGAAFAFPELRFQGPQGKPGGHEVKPLPFDPTKLQGLSEKLLVSHHDNNYAG